MAYKGRTVARPYRHDHVAEHDDEKPGRLSGPACHNRSQVLSEKAQANAHGIEGEVVVERLKCAASDTFFVFATT